jgi:CHAT domain-containing protein
VPLPTSLLQALVNPDAAPGAGATLVAATSLFELDGVIRRAILFGDATDTKLIDLGPCSALEVDFDRWAQDPVTTLGDSLLHFASCLAAQLDGHARLIWLPDENLARFPIAALPLDACRRLIEVAAVVQPRDAYALLARREPKLAPPLLVGVSTFDAAPGEDALESLPGVLEEISRVRDIYAGQCHVLTDGTADAGAVLQALRRGPWIAHVATHGLSGTGGAAAGRSGPLRRQLLKDAPEDPLARCALVFTADSTGVRMVTARALAGMDLRQTSLVVLSACDSGRGRADAAEGVLGFQAALHLAGVATVVTSLWPLHDESTPKIMETLHRLILQGARPSAALQRAQLEAAGSWRDPQAWGGMTVSGSDDPLVDALTSRVAADVVHLTRSDANDA